MKRLLLTALCFFAWCLPASFANAQRPQNSTQGCGSPIILNSSVNRLELNCSQNTPELAKAVARLNELASRKILTTSDLQTMATVLNAKIDKISNDTDEILMLVRDLVSRLDIASTTPGKAASILRPYLDPAIDISNRAYDVNEFLDADGKAEYRLVFKLEGDCQVFITPPRGTGFNVGIAVFSDRGSKIWASLIGTQGRYSPLPLSTGTYQFGMKAKRGAGQYTATISARCG